MTKALNCPNCAAVFDPKESNCAYCGSYIITSEAKQITYDLNEFKPTYKKIFFHGIEMLENEWQYAQVLQICFTVSLVQTVVGYY